MKRAALLLFGTLAFALHAAEPAALTLTQTIPLLGVKGRFDHFAIDTAGKCLFIAALDNNILEVVHLAAGKRSRSLAGMCTPAHRGNRDDAPHAANTELKSTRISACTRAESR